MGQMLFHKKHLLFVCFFLSSLCNYAQVAEQWARRYNGPVDNDFAQSVVVDGSGYVYVTGWSTGSGTDYDYATIKYDAAGNEIWVSRYNGPENSSDVAKSIVVDGSGNVYVTGTSKGSGEDNYDYATVKYDAAGNQLWATRYDGLHGSLDEACGLAVDGSGNVYVTGYSKRGGIDYYDYATVKYDNAGKQLWVRKYFSTAIFSTKFLLPRVAFVAVDDAENVYVSGSIYGNGTGQDYATIKYDANGTELWVRRYDGTGKSEDVARSMAVDAHGNVYVTGYSNGNVSIYEYDYATVKYDTNGNEVWVRRYDGPGTFDVDVIDDQANAIAVDNAGNVYVTGKSFG